MSYQTDESDDVESYVIAERDGETFARATYIPPGTPRHRHETWIVDFANGERLTGSAADEVVKRLLNDPGTDGISTSRFDRQADAILDTVIHDANSGKWRVTLRGVRVWFEAMDDEHGDVVLYEAADRNGRAGVIEDAPFSASELRTTCKMERDHVQDHV